MAETIGEGGGGLGFCFFFNYYFLMNRSVRTSANNPRATFALLKVTTRRQAVRQQPPVGKGRGGDTDTSPMAYSTYGGRGRGGEQLTEVILS